MPEEKKLGKKCGICGEIFNYPKGYHTFQYSNDASYELNNHTNLIDCIKYLKNALENTNSRVDSAEDDIRSIVNRLP